MQIKKKIYYIILLFFILLNGYSEIYSAEFKTKFSFAVLADPRNVGDTWKNALIEIRDMKLNHEPKFSRAEFIIVAGDMDPLEERYEDYNNIFINTNKKPPFLPVIGNHEFENRGKHYIYARDVIIPSISNVVRRHPMSCDYYFDHKNVRIIVIDGYTELGKNGVINRSGLEWTEKAINSSPKNIDHIFISFHEPAFPRLNHVKDSFNASPKDRDAFWNMLIKHNDKVRAVFVGHTHFYYRMRILNPSSKASDDLSSFPDEKNGIFQIDAGAAGKGNFSTIVQVEIDNKNISFRAIQAQNGSNKPFSLLDEWKMGD